MNDFTINLTVPESDCEQDGNLKLSAMLEYFTQLATGHYEARSLSRDKLESENFRFLLLQTAVKIYRLPKAEENLVLKTWEIGFEGIYFDRAYEIFAESGEKLISADGHWILTDLKHRILSPKKFPYSVNNGVEPDIKCQKMSKYSFSDFTSGIIHKVTDDSIDLNGHVHNTVYADVAGEYMPTDFRNKKWCEMQINWRNEAKIGDEWELFTFTEKPLDHEEYKCIGFIGDTHSFDFTLKAEV